MCRIYSFLLAKSGSATAEYALIVAIVMAGIAAGLIIFGPDIGTIR